MFCWRVPATRYCFARMTRARPGGLLPFPAGAPGVFNSLIIHPKESGHFYAGLDAGDSPESGVYESKDGGEHWQLLSGLRAARIESLAMWPGDPRVLAAGTSKGVFLTNDGGVTWHRISSIKDPEMQDITALAFDPADSNILYAGTPHLALENTGRRRHLAFHQHRPDRRFRHFLHPRRSRPSTVRLS